MLQSTHHRPPRPNPHRQSPDPHAPPMVPAPHPGVATDSSSSVPPQQRPQPLCNKQTPCHRHASLYMRISEPPTENASHGLIPTRCGSALGTPECSSWPCHPLGLRLSVLMFSAKCSSPASGSLFPGPDPLSSASRYSAASQLARQQSCLNFPPGHGLLHHCRSLPW